MKDVYVISIIALIYSVILALVTLIFFNDYLLWAVLGSAVALFNHSLMIQVTKNKLTSYKLVTHLIQRYIFYIVIIAIVYFDTRTLGTQIMINSYIILLLGMISVKIGVLVYATPLIKKRKEEEVIPHDPDNT